MAASLKVIAGGSLGGEEAEEISGREAWAVIAAAYGQALTTPGLSSDDRASMTRQRSYAAQLAGISHLTAARAYLPTREGK
jgi:hypothetical protein